MKISINTPDFLPHFYQAVRDVGEQFNSNKFLKSDICHILKVVGDSMTVKDQMGTFFEIQELQKRSKREGDYGKFLSELWWILDTNFKCKYVAAWNGLITLDKFTKTFKEIIDKNYGR